MLNRRPNQTLAKIIRIVCIYLFHNSRQFRKQWLRRFVVESRPFPPTATGLDLITYLIWYDQVDFFEIKSNHWLRHSLNSTGCTSHLAITCLRSLSKLIYRVLCQTPYFKIQKYSERKYTCIIQGEWSLIISIFRQSSHKSQRKCFDGQGDSI